jgi:periplasmic protein TonB
MLNFPRQNVYSSVQRGSVPDRQRHDEFIWALIFSLLINLLIVFALLTQRNGEKSPDLQPYVVSIAASRQALPGHSSAIPGPTAMPSPIKTKKMVQSPPALRPQSTSVAPALPAQDTEGERTISPVTATERAGAETALPPLITTGGSASATVAEETATGLSIWGDKMAGGHYTAPEYLGGEKPPYPKRAERNGWKGTVLLSLLINADGEVEKVEIAKSSGYELLDQQARASVGAWRFKPARRNGIAIAVTVQQPIIFRPSLPKNDR